MPKKRSLESAGLSDAEYIDIMERVAADNYKNWQLPSQDAALLQALNDNTYNYRGYYNKYPNSRADANTHWTDEFKTVYHPTFSDESIYSGKRSQYNPKGIRGGHWYGDMFVPSIDQLMERRPKFKIRRSFKDGSSIYIAPSKRGTFTAAATKHGMGVQAFASKILANKENYSPAMVKKANFARNASKWHH